VRLRTGGGRWKSPSVAVTAPAVGPPESQQSDDLCHPGFVVTDQHVAART